PERRDREARRPVDVDAVLGDVVHAVVHAIAVGVVDLLPDENRGFVAALHVDQSRRERRLDARIETFERLRRDVTDVDRRWAAPRAGAAVIVGRAVVGRRAAGLVVDTVAAGIRRARDAMIQVRRPRHAEPDRAVVADLLERRRPDRKRKGIGEGAAVGAGVGSRAVDHVEPAADVDAGRALAQMKVPDLGIDEERVAEGRRRAAALAGAARRAFVFEVAIRADVLERIGKLLRRRDRGAVRGEDIARVLGGGAATAHGDRVAVEDIVRDADRGAVDLDADLGRRVDHDIRDIDAAALLHRDADLGVDAREAREARPGRARARDDRQARVVRSDERTRGLAADDVDSAAELDVLDIVARLDEDGIALLRLIDRGLYRRMILRNERRVRGRGMAAAGSDRHDRCP